jgi:hypothetical protein
MVGGKYRLFGPPAVDMGQANGYRTLPSQTSTSLINPSLFPHYSLIDSIQPRVQLPSFQWLIVSAVKREADHLVAIFTVLADHHWLFSRTPKTTRLRRLSRVRSTVANNLSVERDDQERSRLILVFNKETIRVAFNRCSLDEWGNSATI